MAHLMIDITDLLDADCRIHQKTLTVDGTAEAAAHYKRIVYVQFPSPMQEPLQTEQFELDTEMDRGLWCKLNLDACSKERVAALQVTLAAHTISYGIL